MAHTGSRTHIWNRATLSSLNSTRILWHIQLISWQFAVLQCTSLTVFWFNILKPDSNSFLLTRQKKKNHHRTKVLTTKVPPNFFPSLSIGEGTISLHIFARWCISKTTICFIDLSTLWFPSHTVVWCILWVSVWVLPGLNSLFLKGFCWLNLGVPLCLPASLLSFLFSFFFFLQTYVSFLRPDVTSTFMT